METKNAVTALAALAQDSRLDVFRLLVQTGPDGLAAGEVAERLGISPATLSFHLAQLRHAGLITMRRDGRSLIYSADYSGMNALMGFLTENCCGGTMACAPARRVVQAKSKGAVR
jgi:DNA-binding transcriptional ArsR family regulator